MGRRRGGRRRLREQAQTAARAGTPTPAGTAGSVQFNENNALAGSANLTFSTSQGLELTGTLHTEGNLGINMSGTAPTHRILPEIVEWDEESDHATSMDYMRIISFLVEAVKYQHNKLNELAERVDNGSE
jgi:hypothetical protein